MSSFIASGALASRRIFIAALLCAALHPAVAIAQAVTVDPPPADATEPVDATELDTVTVYGHPLGRTSDELVQPVDVVSGDDLVTKRRLTIGESLEQEPGVAVSDFGAGAGRPVIRGQAGPRVQVLGNGIGSLDVSDVSPDHAVTISPAQATQVEIIKGPATLLYGSAAAGGVVNVHDERLPHDPVDGMAAVVEGFYGTNGKLISGIGDLNFGAGGHVLHLDFGASESDDYDIPGNANVDGVSGSQGVLANSATQAKTGALSYGYIKGGSSLAGSVSTLETIYGLPVEPEAFIDMKQTRYDLQGIIDRPFAGFDSIKLRGAYNDYEHTEWEDAATPGTVFQNKQHQARIEAVHASMRGFRGVFGVQLGERQFEAIGDEAVVPATDTRELGVFVIEQYKHRLGSLEGGVRIERDGNRVAPNPASPVSVQDRDFTLTSFSAGSVFELGADHHLKVYATHAQRAPAPPELYAFGAHAATATFERGLPTAKREAANNFEVSLDHHGGRFTWEASVYYETFSDYLFLDSVDDGCDADGTNCTGPDGSPDLVDETGAQDPAGEFLLVDNRQADAKFYGFEAQVGVDVLTGRFKLRVTALTDLVRGSLEGGTDLPRISPTRFGAGLEGGAGPIAGGIHLMHVEDQDRTAALETRTKGYDMLNANVSWHVMPNLQFYLQGRNLLDEDARRHTSFVKDAVPLPGASAIIGFRAEL